MDKDQIADLEVLIGHVFRDKSVLWNALSHSSVKTDNRPSNERLEFLGDSVLGMLVSEALYRRYPEDDEGTLTRIKSQAVSRATLQRVAAAMGLDRFILVGKGVAKREIPASLLGNLYEAIVGAIYLDAGLSATRKFVLRPLDVVIEEIVDDRAERNYKSMLQHHCQKELGQVPVYRVLREAGPPHDRHFDVSVQIGGVEHGRARSGSKKEAEQGAARAAMIFFRAVDETERTPVRGAGTLLQVGPPQGRGGGDEGGRKGRSRRGRRGGRRGRGGDASAQADGGGEEAAETKAKESGGSGRGSRRGSRGRGRRKEETADTSPPKDDTRKGDEAGPADDAPAKKKTRRKPARRKSTAKAKAGEAKSGGKSDARSGGKSGGKQAKADDGAEGGKKKKTTRRRKKRASSRKGKAASSGDGSQAGGSGEARSG